MSIDEDVEDRRTTWAFAFMIVCVTLIVAAAIFGPLLVSQFQPCGGGEHQLTRNIYPDGTVYVACKP